MNLKQTKIKKFPSLSMFAFAQKGKIHIRRLCPRSGVFFLCVFFLSRRMMRAVSLNPWGISQGGIRCADPAPFVFYFLFFFLLNLRWIFLKTLVWLNPLSVIFFSSSYCAVSFVRLSSAGHCSPPSPLPPHQPCEASFAVVSSAHRWQTWQISAAFLL